MQPSSVELVGGRFTREITLCWGIREARSADQRIRAPAEAKLGVCVCAFAQGCPVTLPSRFTAVLDCCDD